MSSDLKTHRSIAMPEVRRMLDQIGNLEGKAVLELGQGTDREFRSLFEEKGMKYFATDKFVKPDSEEYTQEAMESLNTLNSDFYDIIFSCHSFEHCERPVDALRNIHKLLKEGGTAIIITPNACKHQIMDADTDHIMVLTDMQMMRLIRYAGFTKGSVFTQKSWDEKEQDWNLFTVAIK